MWLKITLWLCSNILERVSFIIMANYKFLQPYTFKNGITVKNRVVIPPMTEGSSLADGTVSDEELAYFKQRSGGVGMFISPVANINALGKGFPGELAIDDDKFIPQLREMAEVMKTNGTRAILQIFSAGRMSNSATLGGQQPVSASAVAAPREGFETPRALTEEEVEQTIRDFGQATRRAIQAGFDGVELHGANTYLIQQFFSPHSNRRTDQWGGSLENRMRFPLSVVDEAHRIIEEYSDHPFILGYRISPEEIEEPGIRIEDTLQLIDKLADKPIDYLHISMGTVFRTSLNNKDDQEPLIEKIKRQVNGRVPLISVGSVETPQQAEEVMDANIDFVAIGREYIREPRWIQKVINNDEGAIRYTISPSDLEDLHIMQPYWDLLQTVFHSIMHVSNESSDTADFSDKLAPFEGAQD